MIFFPLRKYLSTCAENKNSEETVYYLTWNWLKQMHVLQECTYFFFNFCLFFRDIRLIWNGGGRCCNFFAADTVGAALLYKVRNVIVDERRYSCGGFAVCVASSGLIRFRQPFSSWWQHKSYKHLSHAVNKPVTLVTFNPWADNESLV